MRRKPQLTVRGRGVVVQLRDTLAPNTTYALDFGSAIRDNNEGNPLYSMRYVFSTGGEIDSMICSGYTADAYEADSVPRSFLWFFPADSTAVTPEYDSTLYLHRPSVIARAENNGIFIAQNLKPVPYRIYAFEDTNGNQLYDPSVDRVGFLDEARNPAELPDFAIWHDSVRGYATAEPQLYVITSPPSLSCTCACSPTWRSAARCSRRASVRAATGPCSTSMRRTRASRNCASTAFRPNG